MRLLILVLLLALPVWAEKWAVVVGIDEYQQPGIVDLNYASRDAQLFADALRKLGYPADNIFLYTSKATNPALRPGQINLIKRLASLKSFVKAGDTLVFYFAGHGVTEGREGYLLPEDAATGTPELVQLRALSNKTLIEKLDATGATNILLVLDACRNDPNKGRGQGDNKLTETFSRSLVFSDPPQQQSRNLAVLFACETGERSWEWEEKQHGFFTWCLVEGLGKARTLQDLKTYVQENVREQTRRYLARPQTPVLSWQEGRGPEFWELRKEAQPVLAASTQEGGRALQFQSHLERGEALAAQGNHAAALVEFTQAIEADPRNANAYMWRGVQRAQTKDLAGALADYTRATELAPENSDTWANLSVARNDVGDRAGALAAADRSLQLSPSNWTAMNVRGTVKYHLGDLQGAAADFGRCIEFAPTWVLGWANRSLMRVALKDYVGALSDATRALELAPGADTYNARAAIWDALGNPAQAAQDRAKAQEFR